MIAGDQQPGGRSHHRTARQPGTRRPKNTVRRAPEAAQAGAHESVRAFVTMFFVDPPKPVEVSKHEPVAQGSQDGLEQRERVALPEVIGPIPKQPGLLSCQFANRRDTIGKSMITHRAVPFGYSPRSRSI